MMEEKATAADAKEMGLISQPCLDLEITQAMAEKSTDEGDMVVDEIIENLVSDVLGKE